jgi:ribose 5-phosphate isomerase B
VSIGARQHTLDEAQALVLAFLQESFSGDARHARRIREIADYEMTKQLPPI